MRSVLLALGLLPTLACRPTSASVEQPEPGPDVQTILSPEVEGAAPLTCDGTNVAIIGYEGKYEAIPLAAFEVLYSLEWHKYEGPGFGTDTKAASHRKSISERLIYQRLLELECRRMGIDYDKVALTEREAKQKRGIEDWPAHLSRRGESEDSLRDLNISELRERSLLEHEGKLEVTAEQVAAEYERRRPNSIDDEVRIRASHIIVEVTDPAGEAAALARAEELYARAIGGEDFAELAIVESDVRSSKGGDLGIFAADKMVEEFSKAAFKLKPGEISKPVRTKFGYHIIAVFGRYPPGELPFEALEQDIIADLAARRLHDGRRELEERLRERYEVENCIPNLATQVGPDV